ncbi:MAG: repair protein RecN [Firmicutes bacterium]|nr:repair protein RecN [Bacillota bacterium]
MLKTLSVSNFALLEQATVDLGSGLNVLTGETGAGKSILIDALETVLGSRASAESIRTGCDYFRVEAVFEINAGHPIINLLDDHGITLEDGSVLIISRRVTRQGKNNILVNGCHVTLSVLRQLGDLLVDMHGQHENQTLLKPESYLAILDDYEPEIQKKLEVYRSIYRDWNAVCSDLEKTKSDSRDRAQRVDMLEWQTKEIASAALDEAEEATLEQEVRLLANAEKITTSINRSYSLLSEGGASGEGGILNLLVEVQKGLESASRFDQSIEKYLAIINEARYQLEDTCSALSNYCERLEFDPAKLAFLQERLDVIDKLKKKYGATVGDILSYYQQAQAELSAIENYEESLAVLDRHRCELESSLAVAATDLDTLRNKVAAEISNQVTEELSGLALPKARLTVNVNRLSRYNLNGINEVSIMFSANPGEDPKPLNKIASGGELSRIALAIKAVAASRESVETMVFDEVDAGIGGQTAAKVAEKIAAVSQGKQVLCITHLPQIVAMADHHIYVTKNVDSERTTTIVSVLSDTARLEETARMLSGDNITPAALDNAKEMFDLAKTKKEKWKKRT